MIATEDQSISNTLALERFPTFPLPILFPSPNCQFLSVKYPMALGPVTFVLQAGRTKLGFILFLAWLISPPLSLDSHSDPHLRHGDLGEMHGEQVSVYGGGHWIVSQVLVYTLMLSLSWLLVIHKILTEPASLRLDIVSSRSVFHGGICFNLNSSQLVALRPHLSS